jgi:hypothetical protein
VFWQKDSIKQWPGHVKATRHKTLVPWNQWSGDVNTAGDKKVTNFFIFNFIKLSTRTPNTEHRSSFSAYHSSRSLASSTLTCHKPYLLSLPTITIIQFEYFQCSRKRTARTSSSRVRYIARLRKKRGLRRNDFSDGTQRNPDILPEVGIAPFIGGACKSWK